jgi:hypothetical protein
MKGFLFERATKWIKDENLMDFYKEKIKKG